MKKILSVAVIVVALTSFETKADSKLLNTIGCTALETGVNTACAVAKQNAKNNYSRGKEDIKKKFIKCKEDANNNNPSDKSARKIAVNECKATKKNEMNGAKSDYKAVKESIKPTCAEAKRKLRECRKK